MEDQHLSGKKLVSYIVSLGETKKESNLEELITFLSSSNGNVRRIACSALGKIRSPEAEIPLLELLDDSKPQVRQYAIKALGGLAGSEVLPNLTEMINNPNEKDYNIQAAKLASMKISRRAGRQEKYRGPPEMNVVITASEIRDFDYCNLKWQFKRTYGKLGQREIEKRIAGSAEPKTEQVYQELLQRKQVLDKGERLHEQHTVHPVVFNRWGWIILLISLIFLFLLFSGGFR